ncbi:MAG: hypothetical protein RBU30_21895 [Polyangia bacterium]|nr:hypothetical protein [Polyangia bacterium]
MLLARLTAAVNQRDLEALAALLRPGEPGSARPDATLRDAAALLRTLSTPGPFQATEPIATSRFLAFRYFAGPGEADPRGIAFLERARAPSDRRWRLRYFTT